MMASLFPFHEHLQAPDVFLVVLLRDPQIARRCTLLNVGEQAGPKPPPTFVVFFDVQRARPEFEDPLQHLDRTSQTTRIGERAV